MSRTIKQSDKSAFIWQQKTKMVPLHSTAEIKMILLGILAKKKKNQLN